MKEVGLSKRFPLAPSIRCFVWPARPPRVSFHGVNKVRVKIVLARLRAQVRSPEAQNELAEMEKVGIPWRKRVEETINRLTPFLVESADQIVTQTQIRLNSPVVALEFASDSWLDEMAKSSIQRMKVQSLRRLLKAAASITSSIESQQVSRELHKVLAEMGVFSKFPLARTNGAIYPDLYFKDYDYGSLPLHSRTKKIEGPNRRGDGTPSNVPDGCELKTNQGPRAHVDAHAPHAGLHIALTWGFTEARKIEITGLWIAYIRICDHTVVKRNVAATTVKYSFGHDHFISLIPRRGELL